MNQPVNITFPHNIRLSVKREDLLHPYISGNKFRKLKYNIFQAKGEGKAALLTFGGAFSNHIAATAAAGKEYGFETIGVIRGDELVNKIGDNPTLAFAESCGMRFKFVTREDYRQKAEEAFINELRKEFDDFYLVPEGGTNSLAVKGCEEILDVDDERFTHICCAVGTGGTIAGISNSALPHQQVLGFPALKGAELQDEVAIFAKGQLEAGGRLSFWRLREGKCRISSLYERFFEKTGILLDPIYTAKLFFGVIDSINKGMFPDNSDILLIHTGGLQGIEGMNRELMRKKLPIIKT